MSHPFVYFHTKYSHDLYIPQHLPINIPITYPWYGWFVVCCVQKKSHDIPHMIPLMLVTTCCERLRLTMVYITISLMGKSTNSMAQVGLNCEWKPGRGCLPVEYPALAASWYPMKNHHVQPKKSRGYSVAMRSWRISQRRHHRRAPALRKTRAPSARPATPPMDCRGCYDPWSHGRFTKHGGTLNQTSGGFFHELTDSKIWWIPKRNFKLHKKESIWQLTELIGEDGIQLGIQHDFTIWQLNRKVWKMGHE